MKKTMLILLFCSSYYCHAIMPILQTLQKVGASAFRVKIINCYMQEQATGYIKNSYGTHEANAHAHEMIKRWQQQFNISHT